MGSAVRCLMLLIKYASLTMDTAIAEDRFDEIIAFDIEPCLGTEKPVFFV